jgi:hypothetical protein
MSTPFVIVPTDVLPPSKSHPVRVTDADRDKARAFRVIAEDAIDATEMSSTERLRVWEVDKAQAVARIAKGEAVTIAARPSEAAAAEAAALALSVQAEAVRNEAQAVAAYDAAVVESFPGFLPDIVAKMHAETDAALRDVEAVRAALSRALTPRALAQNLRAAEALSALTKSGASPGSEYVPESPGSSFVKEVPVSVIDKAHRASVQAFALAPPIAEITAHLDAVSAALTAILTEDPAGEWPIDVLGDELTNALGLSSTPPPLPEPLETREAYNVRVQRAFAIGRPVPHMPSHLGPWN